MKLHEGGVYLVNGTELIPEGPEAAAQIFSKDGCSRIEGRGSKEYDCLWYFKRP